MVPNCLPFFNHRSLWSYSGGREVEKPGHKGEGTGSYSCGWEVADEKIRQDKARVTCSTMGLGQFKRNWRRIRSRGGRWKLVVMQKSEILWSCVLSHWFLWKWNYVFLCFTFPIFWRTYITHSNLSSCIHYYEFLGKWEYVIFCFVTLVVMQECEILLSCVLSFILVNIFKLFAFKLSVCSA